MAQSSNTLDFPGKGTFQPVGTGSNQAFGQVFATPSPFPSPLNDFSFWLAPYSPFTDLYFQASVYGWDPNGWEGRAAYLVPG
jgi:hypothetical protein